MKTPAPERRSPVRHVSGTRILIAMLIAVIVLIVGLYAVLTRLKLGGAEALRVKPHTPPASTPANP